MSRFPGGADAAHFVHAHVETWQQPQSGKGHFAVQPFATYGLVVDLEDGPLQMWGAAFSKSPIPLFAFAVRRVLSCGLPRPVSLYTHSQFWKYIEPGTGWVRYPMENAGCKRNGEVLDGHEIIGEAAASLDRGEWVRSTWVKNTAAEMLAAGLAKRVAPVAAERYLEAEGPPSLRDYAGPHLFLEG